MIGHALFLWWRGQISTKLLGDLVQIDVAMMALIYGLCEFAK